MKKRLPKLTLSFESLRVLDLPTAGSFYTASCPTSCQPTCGNPGYAAGFAAQANTIPACCV